MRPCFVADPIALRIPERTRFEAYDAKSRTSQALQQHPSCGSNSDDAIIDLLAIAIPAHGEFQSLHCAEHVIVVSVSEWTEERLFQCVPPWLGLALCSVEPPTGVNCVDGEPGGASHAYRRSLTSHGSGSPPSRRM